MFSLIRGSWDCFSTYTITADRLLHTVLTGDYGLLSAARRILGRIALTPLTHVLLFRRANLRTTAWYIWHLSLISQNNINELTMNETPAKQQQTIILNCFHVF